MKIAYIIFDGITLLDLIGIYDPVSRLRSMKYMPDLEWDICSFTNTVADNFGLKIEPVKVKQTLEGYDVMVVPGGHGTRTLQTDEPFINWLKSGEKTPIKISICTGSLLLGAAGFLRGKRATTNYREYESLEPYCAQVVKERIVEDGNIITAGAVSASIDLGLFLCEKWAGKEARDEIQQRMAYQQ